MRFKTKYRVWTVVMLTSHPSKTGYMIFKFEGCLLSGACVWYHDHHVIVNMNLIFMDPCIVDYSVEIPTRCSFVIEFMIPEFICRLNMFRVAHRSSSGALNCICSVWFICPYGDRPLSRLSGKFDKYSGTSWWSNDKFPWDKFRGD